MPKFNFYDTDAVKAFLLTTPMPAHSTGTVTAEDVNQVIADALALLTGSLKTEGGAAK